MFTGAAERHSVCVLSDAAEDPPLSLCSGTSNYTTALVRRARVPPRSGGTELGVRQAPHHTFQRTQEHGFWEAVSHHPFLSS